MAIGDESRFLRGVSKTGFRKYISAEFIGRAFNLLFNKMPLAAKVGNVRGDIMS